MAFFSKDVGEKWKGLKQELKSDLYLYVSPYWYYTDWKGERLGQKQIPRSVMVSSKLCVHGKSSQLGLFFVTLWSEGHQASLSMRYSRQEYWSGLPCPPSGHLSDPGIKLMFLLSPAVAGRFFTAGK